MASQEGIWRTYTCMCQRANGQAVCVDVKLLGTTEGFSQNSAILVLLHEYDRFLGAYIMGIWWHGTDIVIHVMNGSVRVWFITLLAGFPHLWPLMTQLFSPYKIPLFHFRKVIGTLCAHLTSYKTWMLHALWAAIRGCIKGHQKEVLAQVIQ
jgi:hypothetical protein